MKYKLHRKQQLKTDLETAWQFFSSPYNLAVLTPASMKFKVRSALDSASIYEGMQIDYNVTPLWGITMGWQTEITQVVPLRSFTDYQKKGPYKLWNHQHDFVENEHGVLMTDTIDYELPFGLLGDCVHRLLVKKKLDYIFDHRFKVLEEKFNT
ncbi:SRPBCC family protein [Sphingobacterium pedocola]|uniref:Ligand-binding SRPBCC domain-containing protein n=1 Tax=Sphingobacterium pedocola TaxID=2082722 RepID=A0ABR9T714_9SPHI|nr:SRPBCC family protein [Sphingobacterium pedocola]MBE8721141.1 hypothetical protein [Sphingobacterium pedocola]